MKKYLDIDVYSAFRNRIAFIFNEFEAVYISFSGGKDSSVLLQLTNEYAKEIGRTFDVFFLDFEAQYTLTIDHVYELKSLSQISKFYHYCLPLENEDNPGSIFRPTWVPWNPLERELWVRNMPEDAISLATVPSQVFKSGQEWEDLLKQFPQFIKSQYQVDKVACLVGIRTDESYHRFRSVAFGVNQYKEQNWSTDLGKGVYNFYPLYDWSTKDIWHSVWRFRLSYNKVYERMWQMGISIHEQRICHPFGQDQRVSLNQWAVIEPDTWAKVVNRVSGANFGNIYAKTSLLGHNGTSKPNYMTWEQYAVFLLESIGLYSPDLRDHYVRKIRILFEYIKQQAGLNRSDISEDHLSRPETLQEWISWKRIARTIEKNDFQCRGLSYGLTQEDKKTMQKLKSKWGKLLGLEHYTDKPMKNLSKEIGYEKD